jgi:hypothetical protein
VEHSDPVHRHSTRPGRVSRNANTTPCSSTHLCTQVHCGIPRPAPKRGAVGQKPAANQLQCSLKEPSRALGTTSTAVQVRVESSTAGTSALPTPPPSSCCARAAPCLHPCTCADTLPPWHVPQSHFGEDEACRASARCRSCDADST